MPPSAVATTGARLAAAVAASGETVIAALAALRAAPQNPDALEDLRTTGADLGAGAHLAKKTLAGAPCDAFWKRIAFFVRAAHELHAHDRQLRILGRFKGKPIYRRLAAEQLAVRRRDWREDLDFRLPLRDPAALATEWTAALAAAEAAAEAEPPRAWHARQMASLRRKHKKAFEERQTEHVTRLRRRAERCRWAAAALWDSDSRPADPAAFDPLVAALREAEIECGLEDFLSDLGEAAPFAGASGLEKKARKRAEAALQRAAEARSGL